MTVAIIVVLVLIWTVALLVAVDLLASGHYKAGGILMALVLAFGAWGLVTLIDNHRETVRKCESQPNHLYIPRRGCVHLVFTEEP